MKPRIGIPVPTSIRLDYNQKTWAEYVGAVAGGGAEPMAIELSLDAEAMELLAESCHGFMLPGSPADVDPLLYDTPRQEACGPGDAARERADYLLLAHAARTGKPLLGICYGSQSMNAFHGGTLVQDLMPLPVNHEASKVAVAHAVLIQRGSLLGSILLGDEEASAEATPAAGSDTPTGMLRLPVNSSHHQATALVGRGLRVVARCPDDEVVEAIELDPVLPLTIGDPAMAQAMFHVERPGRFLLGLQWHPERSVAISAASRAIFRRLADEAIAWVVNHKQAEADVLALDA